VSQSWEQFFTSTPIVGGLVAILVWVCGWLYNLYLRHEKRENDVLRETRDLDYRMHQIQLDGWVAQSNFQQKQISILERRIAEKDLRIAKLEEEVTNLLHRIRALEHANRTDGPGGETS
jgi:uncharacterized coiled-coil protein SlyX